MFGDQGDKKFCLLLDPQTRLLGLSWIYGLYDEWWNSVGTTRKSERGQFSHREFCLESSERSRVF